MMFRRDIKKEKIHWEDILHQFPANVYWKDPFGEYLGCNLDFAHWVGMHSIKDIIGKTDYELPWDKKTFAEMIDSDKTVLKRKKRIVIEKFNRYVMKMPLTNVNGEVIGIFGLSFDASQYKSDLEREWRTLDEIIAVMPGHVYWKDRHYILHGGNALQAQDAGFASRKMLIGKTAYDLLTPDQTIEEKKAQAALIHSYDEEVIRHDKTLTIEERVILPDKSIATYLSKRAPLHDEYGNVTGLVGISFDISDRKKVEEDLLIAKEQAEAANRAKTEFLENMRHDIRTPLTGIVGFARLIQQEAVSEKTKCYADQLVAATTALLDFQNEILDAIKITTGVTSIDHQDFYLKNIAEKVIALIKPKAIIKGLKIVVSYEENLPLVVRGDSKRLFRILLELMINALKFTAAGQIQVNLMTEKQSSHHFILRCVISDTGIGIAPENQEEIFMRFQRLSPSSDGVYEGTGLGLTIVKQFIEDLKGTIYLNSLPGKGATFICLIPMQMGSADHVNQPTQEISPTVLSTHHQPVSILLVEDHEMTSTVTKLLLEEIVCQVDVATDAKHTLRQCQHKKYDLIFMDLGLPDKNGFFVAKDIREHAASMNQKTPIIALTAHIEADNQHHYATYCMNAIFQKPLLKSTAIQILNDYVLLEKSAMPAIDLKLGAKRIHQNEQSAKEMLRLLLKNIDSDVAQMTAAYSEKNWEALRASLHKILGGLSYCGAPDLEQACLQLQTNIKNNNFDNVESLFKKLAQEVENLKTSFSI